MDRIFLCADPCRGNMPPVRRTGRARVGENGSSLLDCTQVPRGRMSAYRWKEVLFSIRVQRGKSIVKQGISIRKAVETDIDCIGKLYEDICDHLEKHNNYSGWKKGIYPVRADAEKGLMENALYAAWAGEKIAGTVILNHEPEEGYKNGKWLTEDDYRYIYVIHTLAVHPEFLKCGIGTKLLMFAEQKARKEGCVSIRLDVVKGNIPAEQLYQKCGYQLMGTVSLGYEAYGLPWYHLYEKVL